MIEELVLKDIELNQKIKPIMERKGIEPDAYIPYFVAGISVDTGEEITVTHDPLVICNGYLASDFDAPVLKESGLVPIVEKKPSAQEQMSLRKLRDELKEPFDKLQPAWRLDKLLLALADWCFNPDTYAVDAGSWSEPETEYIVRWDVHGTIDMEFLFTKVHPLLKKTFFGETNKIRLESAARLLILLEENNLNE